MNKVTLALMILLVVCWGCSKRARPSETESTGHAESADRSESRIEPVFYDSWPFDSTEAARRQDETAERLGVDKYITLDLGGGEIMRLALVPAGEFVMGSPKSEQDMVVEAGAQRGGGVSDEGPQHRVRITRSFYVGVTEVTQDQYKAVMAETPSYFANAGGDAPVESVYWNDAARFCDRLSSMANVKVRLPTEAEWEYMCRAGTSTAVYTGDLVIRGEHNAPALDAIAWYGGNSGASYAGASDSSAWKEKEYNHSRAGTHAVGQKSANGFGLHDMIGSVSEWCSDWCDDGYYATFANEVAVNPPGPPLGKTRIYRGGSWRTIARLCRSATRLRVWPDYCDDRIGFRVVVDLE